MPSYAPLFFVLKDLVIYFREREIEWERELGEEQRERENLKHDPWVAPSVKGLTPDFGSGPELRVEGLTLTSGSALSVESA